MISSGTTFVSGAVTLVPRDQVPRRILRAAGPLLCEVTGLSHARIITSTQASNGIGVAFRLRCEPRIPTKHIGPTALIECGLRDSFGQALALRDDPTMRQQLDPFRTFNQPGPFLAHSGPRSASATILTADHPGPAPERITLSAVAAITLMTLEERTVVMVPGSRRTLRINTMNCEVWLNNEHTVDEDGGVGVGLITALNIPSEPQLRITGPDGAEIQPSGQSSSLLGGRREIFHRIPELDAGPYQVHVGMLLQQHEVEIPIDVELSLP